MYTVLYCMMYSIYSIGGFSFLIRRSCVLGVLGALLLAGSAYDLTYRLMSWVLLARQEQEARAEESYAPVGGREEAERERTPLLGDRSSPPLADRPRPPAALEEDEDLLPPARSNAITPGILALGADADDRYQQQRSSGAMIAAGTRDRSSLDDPRPPPMSARGATGGQTSINASNEEASVGDERRTPRASRPWRHGAFGRLLLCFSLPSNLCKIFHVESAKAKANSEQLDCLHGLRLMSMVWVIWGHSYVFAANYAGASCSSENCCS